VRPRHTWWVLYLVVRAGGGVVFSPMVKGQRMIGTLTLNEVRT